MFHQLTKNFAATFPACRGTTCSGVALAHSINHGKEVEMRKLALCFVAAVALAGFAAPAAAQVGFYAGPGGIGVGVGAPYYSYSPYGYYNNYVGPGYGWGRPGWDYYQRWP
jgi:hypothetical protein